MERIAGKMPELSYIDEDYGQLEAGADEDHYTVTFPCVLIGNTESDWNDLGYGIQTVSYTHLDVYKRPPVVRGTRMVAGTGEVRTVHDGNLKTGNYRKSIWNSDSLFRPNPYIYGFP